MNVKIKFESLVTIQRRMAKASLIVGLGVWVLRAGSIGRDGQRLGENTDSPQWEAEGLGPRPLRGEIIAL